MRLNVVNIRSNCLSIQFAEVWKKDALLSIPRDVKCSCEEGASSLAICREV
jgi:hypothetical protein